MDGFQEMHCPCCRKRLPFQVRGGLAAHQSIRYQCRQCKQLLYVQAGLVPRLATLIVTGTGTSPQD